MSAPPAWERGRLEALAHAMGVAPSYVDQGGTHREVADDVIADVLAALGCSVADDADIGRELERLRLEPWRRTLPPVIVVREGDLVRCPIHLPHGSGFTAATVLEDGRPGPDPLQVRHDVEPVWLEDAAVGEAMVEVGGLPLGWHLLLVETAAGRSRCPVVVTPRRLAPPAVNGAGWGFATQLYSVSSAGSWGLGDLADLAELARWSGTELGADLVLVNPLHAAEPTLPRTDSPYLPTSRRFRDPSYLRVELLAEYERLSSLERDDVAALRAAARAANPPGALLQRDPAWIAKLAALRLVHAAGRSAERQAEYDAYRAREGDWLRDFATWCALAEELEGVEGPWPEELADVGAPGVAAARERLVAEVDFHCWLQWQVDEQLAAAQRAARAAGQGVGVVHDLAVGVHPGGADAWTWPDLLLQGVSVGAPPELYNPRGQDWSQPPWSPRGLAEVAYRPYRDLVAAALRHAGGLRVDHVIGLFRLWLIPRGRPAAQGTYVRYDAEALLGILALEAQRAGAVIIGEDLGTVEPEVAATLAERGVLGTDVLFFERSGPGAIRPPEDWRRESLATVTVHDLPPSLGYLAGEHVRLQAALGILGSGLDAALEGVAAERHDWATLARERGLLADAADDDAVDDAELVVALHRLLGQSPARLLAVSLADAAGERRIQNLPGTHREYANWRVPLADSDGEPVTLERLETLELPRRLAAAVSQARSRPAE